MKGAREYAGLFKTGQYGKLYIVSGSHARGATFHIFVLPKDVAAIPNGRDNAPLNTDAVEVYGITGGQPGWTETYGWLHEGAWQSDFMQLVELRKMEIETAAEMSHQLQEDRQAYEAERIKGILSNY